MVCSSGLGDDALRTQFVGALVEVVEQALAIPFFMTIWLATSTCQTANKQWRYIDVQSRDGRIQ